MVEHPPSQLCLQIFDHPGQSPSGGTLESRVDRHGFPFRVSGQVQLQLHIVCEAKAERASPPPDRVPSPRYRLRP